MNRVERFFRYLKERPMVFHSKLSARDYEQGIKTLRTYGISPVKHPSAIELIMKQAQALYKDSPTVATDFIAEPIPDFDSLQPHF